MRSDLQNLRAAAEPYKSFPVAVAAVVQAMFDRQASEVLIRFEKVLNDPLREVQTNLTICGGRFFQQEINGLIHSDLFWELSWPLAFVHHAGAPAFSVNAYEFIGLGQGDGVNPRQDRSAKRLVRELPRHLSPSEAYRTVVIDEQGTEHKLVKSLPSTTIDGLRVSWPERLVGFGRESLILKFSAVRVSMRSFLDRLILAPQKREQLMLLTHPWLQGIVEVEVADPRVADIPIPPKPGDNLSNFIIPSGHAERLARAILQIVPAVALREMNRTVNTALRDFCNQNGELVLGVRTYKLTCADEMNLWRLTNVALGESNPPWGHRYECSLNLTNPIFRTIGPDRDEIMQIIWWQLAIWIMQNKPEMRGEARFTLVQINQTYLALREQNPECWGD